MVSAAAQVRISEVCTDAGDFGWQRYEQWAWSKGVQHTVESLYKPDEVLPPGQYELQVHTAAVVTGREPTEAPETVRAGFTVGAPAGFPAIPPATATDTDRAAYPLGGPLCDLSTYTERSMPAPGERPWYRRYDTAVRFTEPYLTRMYLEAGRELRVSVFDAAGAELRPATRHVWSSTDAASDAWSTQWVRTLNGDGTDPCATVDLDRVVRPEQVVAGAGEPLAPQQLHRSELRAVGDTGTVTVHRFDFVTSRYASLTQHAASFDGRCRSHPTSVSATALALPARAQADMFATALASTAADALPAVLRNARDTRKKATTGTPTTGDLDAADAALTALLDLRDQLVVGTARVFGDLWAACFESAPPATLPAGLRVSVLTPAGPTGATPERVLLLESPEPLAWERISARATYNAALPLSRVSASIDRGFGHPDAGFDIEHGGLRWHAGVELWVSQGVVRARADEPLDVSVLVDRAGTVELELDIDAGATATVATVPALAGGPVTKGPSASGASVTVTLAAPTGTGFQRVRITGAGVGIRTVGVTEPFIPGPAAGPLRLCGIRLPTSTAPLDHEVIVIAMAPVANLSGYTVRWVDALNPAAAELYAELPAVGLDDGHRLRLVPGRATAPVTDDALVSAGGPGTAPPTAGAVYQLIDPAGNIVHQGVALATPSAATPTSGNLLVPFPNADRTRAFLVPPNAAPAIGRGHWNLRLDQLGDAGIDLPVWSVAGRTVTESAMLAFSVL